MKNSLELVGGPTEQIYLTILMRSSNKTKIQIGF